jgi:uncharacterized protein (TIGR02145 family)
MKNYTIYLWMIAITIIPIIILVVGCQKDGDPDPVPVVNITSPSEGASLTHGDKVTINVNAESTSGNIQEVRLFLNNQGVAADDTFPYQFEWNTAEVDPGDYILMAKADDSNGHTGSDEINVTLATIYTPGSFTDSRDGQTYPMVTLGNQTWMAENLNYETDTGSWIYDGKPEPYGRYYSWYMALQVCPDGWHLPSDSEWNALVDFLGGKDVAGGKMKSITDHWTYDNVGATNMSGFTGLPAGLNVWEDIHNSHWFNGQGFVTGFWSSSPTDETSAWSLWLETTHNDTELNYSWKRTGLSVRCLKDN